MFCKYCGNLIEDTEEVCEDCKKQKNIKENTKTTEKEDNRKSKMAAGLFGIFLGVFGVHNFYLGYNSKAVAQLLITLLSFGAFSFVSAIWGFIEVILILTGGISKDGLGELIFHSGNINIFSYKQVLQFFREDIENLGE